MCFRFFPQLLCETLFTLRRTERDMTITVCRSACKVPVIVGRVNEGWIFSTDFQKKTSPVYDCTVEDVEYIYNKLSIHIFNSKRRLLYIYIYIYIYIHVVSALTGAHMQPACVTELTSSEYWDIVVVITFP